MKGSVILNILLLLLVLCSFVVGYQYKDYGIMIDAGSSGSRIYLYEWPHRDDPTIPIVSPSNINQVAISKKIDTPLSSFENNPTQAGESLESLITYVQSYLQPTFWAYTPIYLKATAGMRKITNVTIQEEIIDDVRAYLHNSPFSFQDSYANIITGSDEGFYGWITVNYLMGVFKQHYSSDIFGALDMGGASTQITFKVDQKEATQTNAITTTLLGGSNYTLYAFSYPLGQDQARREMVSGFASENSIDENGNIKVPCYLKGYKEPYGTSGLYAFGSGNFTACREAVLKYIVMPNETCTSCGMRSVYQPSVNVTKFIAFSAFAYAYKFFNLSSNATINQLIESGQEFCPLDYADVMRARKNNTYAYGYCFASIYFSEALIQYGFSPKETQIVFNDILNLTEVTWALGAMIRVADLLPFGNMTTPTQPPSSSSSSTTIITVSGPSFGTGLFIGSTSVLFVGLLLVGFLFGWKKYKIVPSSAPYNPLYHDGGKGL